MNNKAYLVLIAVACLIAVVSAQSSVNPVESLQSKASGVAASATNTSPSAPSNTAHSAGFSLATSLSSTVMMQLVVICSAFIASYFLA
ncbi:hypothetical protein BCV72DRAFT_339246 [Rhizopus microsporus var. microsporus]|uniref:Uncharacterized protein n=2 Tax=Rhizopus microsporus TaxID=58291 RepID=A0A2G4T6M2_RHIZD|nr:uncharacterized protein RHIMIDRAFT_289166 [Rhizopus microsporus ATCC 52813]ORE01687.1 hypothetical protein BCV72DRAFT_339246 [Rhizopus microsporus var. microsporus]PHZ16336.1 hypothetical protein RHIMIDRAFT_289166 [Rhizopus microsporus ATCC 52813]